MMPKMNGMEVLKSLRQDAWGKTVPVILLTNMPTDDAVIKEIVEEHPTFYLVKSDWKLEDVLHKVEQTLEMM
jgi:CheY-like chemotaxis protein